MKCCRQHDHGSQNGHNPGSGRAGLGRVMAQFKNYSRISRSGYPEGVWKYAFVAKKRS